MWVLIALICLLLLLIIILSLPVYILFSFTTEKSPHLRLYLKWFYGLVHINLRKDRKKRSKDREEKGVAKKPEKEFNPNVISRILGIRGLFRQVYHLIRDLLHSSRIKTIELDLKVGLEDPVDNGYLFALVTPVNYSFSRTPYNISIQTAFENELVIDCNMYARIRVFPILVTGGLIRFLFSVPAFNIIKIIMDSRWQRKR